MEGDAAPGNHLGGTGMISARFNDLRNREPVNAERTRRDRRLRYRFIHRFEAVSTLDGMRREMYCWEAAIPGDSRVHRITCPVDWFWSSTKE